MNKINLLHIKAYERDLKIRNRSLRTAQNYRETLLQLDSFVSGADLLELSRTEVEGYILHVLESRSAASASGRYRALRAFYNWAGRTGGTDAGVADAEDDAASLAECSGSDFESRRDTAIILEVGGLLGAFAKSMSDRRNLKFSKVFD
ncbi:site-specific integrase [Micromonospora sp. Llam7]|uniref:site-specific integrase n=1 Tax=Micromonospora tarapacensis TaxID=2835305 RepID=UPI001C830D3A|nr:site-specific integrase [Micromonospora tarapacensis]MBX7270125.1 site-specific integrase [Micromonospora tarapacensis]